MDGSMKKLSKVVALAEHPWLPQLIHLRRIDASARKPNRFVVANPELVTLRLNTLVEEHFLFNQMKKQIAEGIRNAP